MTGQQKQSGFTLIEMVVAVAIFAMMSTLAYAGLASVLSNDRASLEHETALKKLQRSMLFIEKDVRQIVARPRNPGYSELIAALKSGGGYGSGLFEFTRAGNSNPTDLNRSSLQRVRYVLDEEKLKRLSWNLVDHNDAQPLTMTLLEDVSEMGASFLSSDGEQVSDWGKDELPVGIELTLTHTFWGEIRRVFPLYY